MRAIGGFVAAALALVFAAPAGAQDTSKPITMIVPFAPGGSTDVIGRVIADGLHGVARGAGRCEDDDAGNIPARLREVVAQIAPHLRASDRRLAVLQHHAA